MEEYPFTHQQCLDGIQWASRTQVRLSLAGVLCVRPIYVESITTHLLLYLLSAPSYYMSFITSIEVSLEEARALFQTVREGARRVEENPHRRDDVNLSRSTSALIAERVASSIMVKLGEEVFSLDADDPRRIAAGMVDDLYDVEVPELDSIGKD